MVDEKSKEKIQTFNMSYIINKSKAIYIIIIKKHSNIYKKIEIKVYEWNLSLSDYNIKNKFLLRIKLKDERFKINRI